MYATTNNTENDLKIQDSAETNDNNFIPSKLIRGLSNIPHEDITKLVITAFKNKDLQKQADGLAYSQIKSEADLEVKDCSGCGGCRTFKVSAKDSESSLPPLVVHSRLNDHPEHLMARWLNTHTHTQNRERGTE